MKIMWSHNNWIQRLFIIFSIYIVLTHGKGEHVKYMQSCRDNKTCDKNLGLHCNEDSKVCECSKWSSEHAAEVYVNDQQGCRVPIGGSCTRLRSGDDASKCMNNADCKEMVKNERGDTEFTCMCANDGKGTNCDLRGQGTKHNHVIWNSLIIGIIGLVFTWSQS